MKPPLLLLLPVLAGLTLAASSRESTAANRDPFVPPVKVVATYQGHALEVLALAFSPDGKRLVSGSLDDVREWDPATGKDIKVLKAHRCPAVAFSPDGQRLAIAAPDAVTIQDALTRKVLLSIDPHGAWNKQFPFRPTVLSLAFSPDGTRIATAASVAQVGGRHGYPGGVVKVWDAATGRELRALEVLSHPPAQVAFSPDGRTLAGGTGGAGGELPEPGELRLWDAGTGKLQRLLRVREEVKPGQDSAGLPGLAFSPDGGRLASACSDGVVRVWDTASGRELLALRGHKGWVRRVAFSPDGKRLASAGGDRVVRVWDVATGRETATLAIDVPRISALAFSPDGRRLAAGGGVGLQSGQVRVWALTRE